MFKNQLKDIEEDLRVIDEIAVEVNKNAEQRPPKAYKAQCRSLTERIMIIKDSIATLKVKRSDPSSVAQALSSLKDTLAEAEELIKKLSTESFLRRVFVSNYPAEFARINQSLTENMQQLNLALTVKKIVNPEQDKQDREKDYQDMLTKQGEMIEMARAAQEKEEIFSKKVDSIQDALKKLSPMVAVGRRSKIPEDLQVPFFQLEFGPLLAEGGFGKVYLGKYLGQEVAIKWLDRILDEKEQLEFQREVQILSRLHSDYILPVYAVCDEPKRTCIVMKYMANGSLRYLLEKKAEFLTPRHRHQLALDIALGLYYLHEQNIIHRDLNSYNVLIDSEGRARLADFGLSKSGNSNVTTLEKQGSALRWQAPEILLRTVNWHALTIRSDMYSYGILLLEIMTDKVPADDKTESEFTQMMIRGQRILIPDTVGPIYRKIIESCCREQPDDRPATMKSIILQLESSFPSIEPEAAMPKQIGFFSSALQSVARAAEVDSEEYYVLACHYTKEKNYEKAVILYEKAVAGGCVEAKTNLALLYMYGKGVPVIDEAKAYRLLTEAARAGHETAMKNLAKLLATGSHGIPQDIEQAIEWYGLLAGKGDKEAKKELLSLRSQSFSNSSMATSSRYSMLGAPSTQSSSSTSSMGFVKRPEL